MKYVKQVTWTTDGRFRGQPVEIDVNTKTFTINDETFPFVFLLPTKVGNFNYVVEFK